MTKKYLYNILTIDPGLVCTAMAHWKGDLNPKTYFFYGKGDFALVRSLFAEYIDNLKPKKCIIEDADFGTFNTKWKISAKRGDTKKLIMVVSKLQDILTDRNIGYRMIKPHHWKGDLPDEILKTRVTMMTNKEYTNIHTYCAVGIGLSIMKIL